MSSKTETTPSRSSEYDYLLSKKFKVELYGALRHMGLKYVKPEYHSFWSEENPTFGYCYTICELIHYLHPEMKSFYVKKKKDGLKYNHWFLRFPDARVWDSTPNDNYDYDQGVRGTFLYVRGGLSARARELGQHLRLLPSR